MAKYYHYIVFNKSEEKKVEKILKNGLEVDSIPKRRIYEEENVDEIQDNYDARSIIIIRATTKCSNIQNADSIRHENLIRYSFDKSLTDSESSESEVSDSESSYSSEDSEDESKASRWNKSITDTLGVRHSRAFSRSSTHHLTINTLDLDERLAEAENNGKKNCNKGR